MLVNIHEAKSTLSQLVRRATAGEEIIIGRNGEPVARLVAYRDRVIARQPGRLKGRIRIAEDFDATSSEVIESFEGGT